MPFGGIGSPMSMGDIGEDDGMELGGITGNNNNRQDAFSSVVDSAEKRDKVGSMVFDHDKSIQESEGGTITSSVTGKTGGKKKKAKSAIAGNFLRVRTSSHAAQPSNFPGIGALSGVNNAANDP
jgi:hypothetical protein